MLKSCVFPFLRIKTKCCQRYLYTHSHEWTSVLVESSVIRDSRLWLRCESKHLFIYNKLS